MQVTPSQSTGESSVVKTKTSKDKKYKKYVSNGVQSFRCVLCDHGEKNIQGINKHLRKIHGIYKWKKNADTQPKLKELVKTAGLLQRSKSVLYLKYKVDDPVFSIIYECIHKDFYSLKADSFSYHFRKKHPFDHGEEVSPRMAIENLIN